MPLQIFYACTDLLRYCSVHYLRAPGFERESAFRLRAAGKGRSALLTGAGAG
jgi:hypothetical protein